MSDSLRDRLLTRLVGLDDLSRNARVVVACSGGADSLALLALACARGHDVAAVYVDHGLRPSTHHEAMLVEQASARAGAGFRVEHVEVGEGSNLEARARAARYDALRRAQHELSADAVLVGHTRDDQAETVLLNLLRGSAASGLGGMAAVRGSLRRPLLELRRAETHELCFTLGFTPVNDPMNEDCRHRRVWLRREVVPHLAAVADRDIVEVLARQAAVLRDDAAYLDQLAAARMTQDSAELAALPVALARRVVREWLGAPPPSFATVERVLSVARGAAVATELPGGDRIERIGGRLVRLTGDLAAPPHAVQLAIPGQTQFGAIHIEAWVENGPPVAWPDGRWTAVCDADLCAERVTIDVADGVPDRRRGVVPMLSAGGPIWTVGYRIDRRVRVTSRTRRFLWLSAEPVYQ
ncbi:MAG TPA: tRNA lysidine(34) synthetase TilS [Acidimicrobiia bacterium]|nr:tRNA lysidine(34) synthetase TilS [Acidimicrobiia bacterium]